jgi:hypothetical protein
MRHLALNGLPLILAGTYHGSCICLPNLVRCVGGRASQPRSPQLTSEANFFPFTIRLISTQYAPQNPMPGMYHVGLEGAVQLPQQEPHSRYLGMHAQAPNLLEASRASGTCHLCRCGCRQSKPHCLARVRRPSIPCTRSLGIEG